MNSKVHFSTVCIILTAAIQAILIFGIILTWQIPSKCIPLSIITITLLLCGTFYCPTSISANSAGVTIHRLIIDRKAFKYSDIESVKTCYPSSEGIRLRGSCGYFGYWGYFSDIIIGRYFAYYADRSQCILIKLKNNRKYVISCEKHIEMARKIQGSISHNDLEV